MSMQTLCEARIRRLNHRANVLSGNSPIDSEMVENTPIFKSNLQEQTRLNHDQESNANSQKWDKLITNKKSVIKIILDQCDKNTRVEITLNSSYEDNMKAGELIKFLMRVHKICDDTKDKDVFFGSRITEITKHHFRPTTIVKQILTIHLIDDAIWDNTNPCDVSRDNVNGTEVLANIDVTEESITTKTTSISTIYNKVLYNAHTECDFWHDVLKTMDSYQAWDDPSTILEDVSPNYESPKEYIEPVFLICNCQT